MRNFLAFLRRFRVFLVFAALQGFVLTIYFTFVAFPRTQFLTTASSINGSILEVRNDITKHFALSENNTKLQEENIRLRKLLKDSRFPLNDLTLSDSIVLEIEDTLWEQQYDFVPAIVINSTHGKRNNYFTLDIGSDQGVEPGMGVFSDLGVVGVIHNVSRHYSVVKSCLTKDINISAMIENSGHFGLMKWEGISPRKGSLTGVSNDTDVKLWSKVVTKGSSGIFPRGLPIGKVCSKSPVEGEPLWNIEVLFSEDYRSIQRVYVIKNLMKKEQAKLENQIPTDIH